MCITCSQPPTIGYYPKCYWLFVPSSSKRHIIFWAGMVELSWDCHRMCTYTCIRIHHGVCVYTTSCCGEHFLSALSVPLQVYRKRTRSRPALCSGASRDLYSEQEYPPLCNYTVYHLIAYTLYIHHMFSHFTTTHHRWLLSHMIMCIPTSSKSCHHNLARHGWGVMTAHIRYRQWLIVSS